MKYSLVPVFAVSIAVLTLFLPPRLFAQEDLSIPGLDDPAPAAVAGAPSGAGDASASQGDITLIGLIKAGGWTMWILGAFSLGLVGLAIYNFMDLRQKNFYPEELFEALEADMDTGDIESATSKTETSPTCLGQIVYGAMDYIVNRGYGVLDGEHLDNLMADASRSFNRGRARVINYFSVIAQAAPLVGLLGTVSGMIKAFSSLNRSGGADPSQLAGNISEALVTTASGLVIAIPAIFGYFYFRDRLSNFVHLSDERASKLMNRFRNAVYAQNREGVQHDEGEDEAHGGLPVAEPLQP